MEELKKHIIAVILSDNKLIVGGNGGSIYRLAGPGFQVLCKQGSEVFDTVEEAVDYFLTRKKKEEK